MEGDKPKGFGEFDKLARKLVQIPPDELAKVCPTCGGTGEIDDSAHPDHPSRTGDGTHETWCIDCDGTGTREAYEAKATQR